MSSPDPQRAGVPSSRLMTVALVGAAVLALAGGGAFYFASQKAARPVEAGAIAVRVGAKSCEPMDLTVPAGRNVFEIENASDRPIEWEILDGVMVVEERENIAPGFKSQLTARLKPGTYDITCGLLSNPRGKLTVTASAHSEAERAKPPLKAFIGPLSEYKVYLALQSGQMSQATQALATAVDSGDLAAARTAYAAARIAYRHVEAVSGRIADIENAIDPIAAYLAGREQDPAFTGFHRIEFGLWHENSAAGLKPVADKLAADAAALRDRLKALKFEPADLAGNASREARRLAEGPIVSGDSLYAGDDLSEFAAAVDGLEKPVSLLLPLAGEASPDTAKAVTDAFAATRAEIGKLGGPGSAPVAYSEVPPDARKALAAAFVALADAVDRINPALGLE
ncbi:iron uptake system protein EfeO [Pleomorphomonas carboxyditropha]|uniref:Iron transporter substrate-binding protein n=1 Tax=Pleomorphomonas carboxyditropha TaxID=2023338 RepID=A0A2G9WPQ0_9HYPH|nr:iron uptake system protein EfeO [Pleomorphomonas carboxyditropha]PIO96653.1 iron transporter substrate-binding protein [Pleomorphomonas carboxyditropha]